MASTSIAELKNAINGQVITPEDPEYDPARTLFYGGFDRHPEVIIQPKNTADVVQVVNLARETGSDLAVRSGGHSVAGHSMIDGGIVLDLSQMRAMDIDVPGQTAWAEAGVTAGEYTKAAGGHDLATGFGDTGSVGLGGLTLGGGLGYLSRKYGLTIDDLLAAEIVTSDGQVLTVNAGSHPDLFWAIRGGGGNFGVATRFQYRLHEVGEVLGGMLFLPANAEVITAFIKEAEQAPEELSTIANIMPAPPMPFLPAEIHGKLVIWAIMVYAGPIEDGRRSIARFRNLAKPIADMIRPMQYPEIYQPEEGEFHPVAAARSLFMDSFDLGNAETIIRYIQASSAQMAVTQLRVLGGAIARVPVEATAYAHRERRIMANVAALYGNPDKRAKHEDWVGRFAADLSPFIKSVYANFLGNEGPQRVRDAYPEDTWNRLVAIKARYDPQNLFRNNQNIPPANTA